MGTYKRQNFEKLIIFCLSNHKKWLYKMVYHIFKYIFCLGSGIYISPKTERTVCHFRGVSPLLLTVFDETRNITGVH